MAPDDGTAFSRAFGPSDAQADARALWMAWNHGVSPATMVARRSDLRHFGGFAWRVRTEIAVVRRVAALLRGRAGELRELAIAWIDAERERGIASVSLQRRWAVLSSLARFISRADVSPLGTMPREVINSPTRGELAALVARASARGDHVGAAIVGFIGERSMSCEDIAALRVGAALMLPCSAATRAAIERVCEGRRLAAFAFEGRSRGGAISPRGVGFVVERCGTSVAALRRGKDRER